MYIQDTWTYFRTFYSANHTQNYLNQKYSKLQDSERLSYQNCYTLIYYLEHAKKYYDQSTSAPYELQPVLLFYGMVQLMKAAILTVDPNYPETTQVLAHGASTRKRKKVEYEFLSDEVKIQKNGLITHFSEKIFQLNGLEGEKFKMAGLLKKIPEMHTTFFHLYGETVAYPMTRNQENIYSLTNAILDDLHLTPEGFTNYLQEHSIQKNIHIREEDGKVLAKFNENMNPLTCSPLQFGLTNKQYFLPKDRQQYRFFPELLAHYLILYNLSMICRYETDWWGELFHHYSSNDYPFITKFLEVTMQKVPFYVAQIIR